MVLPCPTFYQLLVYKDASPTPATNVRLWRQGSEAPGHTFFVGLKVIIISTHKPYDFEQNIVLLLLICNFRAKSQHTYINSLLHQNHMLSIIKMFVSVMLTF